MAGGDQIERLTKDLREIMDLHLVSRQGLASSTQLSCEPLLLHTTNVVRHADGAHRNPAESLAEIQQLSPRLETV